MRPLPLARFKRPTGGLVKPMRAWWRWRRHTPSRLTGQCSFTRLAPRSPGCRCPCRPTSFQFAGCDPPVVASGVGIEGGQPSSAPLHAAPALLEARSFRGRSGATRAMSRPRRQPHLQRNHSSTAALPSGRNGHSSRNRTRREELRDAITTARDCMSRTEATQSRSHSLPQEPILMRSPRHNEPGTNRRSSAVSAMRGP